MKINTEAFEIYGDALEYFEAYINLPPLNGWNFYVRGQIFETIGRIDDAIGDYGRAIDLDPSKESFRKARGDLLLSEKDAPEAALEDYRALVALAPNEARYHVDASRALARIGDSEAAVEEATKAIALYPSYARAYRVRGDAYADLGRVKEAIADYSKAIELDPEYDIALRSRGDMYRLVEQHDAAVADYTRAIEIDPDYESAIIGRAYALMSLGRFEEAEKDLTRELELDPDYGSVHFARGRTYRHLQKPDLAVIDLARASSLGEIYASLFLYLTEWPKDEFLALAHLSEAASTWGSQDWPRPIMDYFLGVLSREALSATATNDGEQCEVEFYVASALLLRQETEVGIDLLRKAVEICPHDFIEYEEARQLLAVLAK